MVQCDHGADEWAVVTHHHSVLDDGAGRDLLFHRDGRDVLAAGSDDDVLGTAGQRDMAFIVNRRQIAGLEPAILCKGLGCLLGQIMITKEHVLALHLKLAGG